MNSFKLINTSLVFVAVLVVGVLVFGRTSVGAQALIKTDDNKPAESSQGEQKSNAYSYVAQAGDSYSLMARKAVQTYGIINNVNLSGAQIIYAETNLTKEAGSPVLLLGQKVELKEDLIKNWVNKAKELNADQQSAWNVYVKYANFNTDKVGQSS